MKIWRRTIAVISTLALLLNSLFVPVASLAQVDPTPSPTPVETGTTPDPEATVSPTASATSTPEITPAPTEVPTPITTTTSSPTVTPEPTPTQSPSPWTFEKVELNKEYVYPQNNQVKLTFTKLPNPSGNIKIEEITLTEDQVKETGSLSNKAYDITSDMNDGDFTYNLSLPIPKSAKGKAINVKFAEEISKIDSAEKVGNTLTKTETSVSVASLDHFTIFIVTVAVLHPSYSTPGGGGVFSAYVGPPDYGYVSPGSTAVYDGREAGIIKAGLNIHTDGHYRDQGLFFHRRTSGLDPRMDRCTFGAELIGSKI